MKSRKTPVKSYILDTTLLADYWNCFPNSKRIYHHTVSSTLLYGFREAIALFIERGGLEVSWQKCSSVSKKLYSDLESHGFKMFIKDVKNRAPSVTSIVVPAAVDPVKVAGFAMNKYKFEIAGGLGPTVGKVFRIGLMGINCTNELVDKTIEIILEAIEETKSGKLESKM